MSLSLIEEWKRNTWLVTRRRKRPRLNFIKSSAPDAVITENVTEKILTIDQGSFFSKGSAQVTDVCDILSHTSEVSDILSDTLARAAPHAPNPPRQGSKKDNKTKNTKRCVLNIRMSCAMKAKLEAKAAAAESYPSAYVLKLVAANLCLPIDEGHTARSRGLQEKIAALTIALNRQGGLFNQIAAALNRGQPCPVTRQEIKDAWRRHMAATNAIIRLGFD